jgi:hypothetical protein
MTLLQRIKPTRIAAAAVTLFLIGSQAIAQDRPGLLYREDWKELPAAIPASQEHVSNPNLLIERYGPGKEQIKKSHHDQLFTSGQATAKGTGRLRFGIKSPSWISPARRRSVGARSRPGSVTCV